MIWNGAQLLYVALATNDDGIEAPGLKALVKSLADEGFKVYVVAPRRSSSGTGKAIQLKEVRYGATSYPYAHAAWWLDSTSATCVYAGLRYLLPEAPDIVVSGVNKGPNMGFEDFLTSGTIGAALEGSLQGVVSVAVSLATDEGYREDEYLVASRIAAMVARMLVESPPRHYDMLNINVPVDPRGVLVTRLSWNNYRIDLESLGDKLRPVSHRFRDRYWDRVFDTDVWAVLNGYVSITPVSLRLMAESGVSREAFSEAEDLLKGFARLPGAPFSVLREVD